MAFLNPAVLIALAAASIPLLLHLLNLRKLRKVEFSSLRFLKELQKTRIRKVKLKQILLLLLRTGLVIFAVLAFARPVLQGTSGLPGARAAGTAVIVLDNSVSMQVKDNSGERFRQAKRVALDILGQLGEGDDAGIISLTDPGSGLDRGVVRNRETLLREVEEMEPGYGKASLADGLNVATELLKNAKNLNREIYVITDGQEVNLEGFHDAPVLIDRETRVRIIPIGRGDVPANVGIDSLKILSSIFEADKPLEIRAWVTNYGEEALDDVVASMYIEESRMAQTSLSIEPGESVTIDLSAPPRRTGFLGGYLQIEGDNLEEDSRRYFAFRIVDGSRVAVFAAGESVRFLEASLGLPGLLRPQVFAPSALGSVDLGNFPAVVVADLPRIGSGAASRLAAYVEAGGGLVVWGGPAVDRSEFNASLGASLRLPLGEVSGRGPEDAPLEFSVVEKEHPVFAGVFDGAETAGRVESPKIGRVLPAGTGDPIITLTNGMPFMTEYRRGKGRVMYIGVPPSATWSNLPFTSIFVPIAVRSVLYVGASGEEYQEFIVGDNILVSLPFRGDIPEQVQVVPPSGPDQFVPVRNYETGISVGYDAADQPGIYRVMAAGKEVARFAVNMEAREGDLRPVDNAEWQDRIAGKMETPEHLAVVEQAGDAGSLVLQSRMGLELWRYMLALALLCAFGEMIVGRAGGKSDASGA